MSDEEKKEEKAPPPPPPKVPERGMKFTDADKLPPPPKIPEKGMKAISSDLLGKETQKVRATGVVIKDKEDK